MSFGVFQKGRVSSFLEGTWFGELDTGEEMNILGSRDLDAQPCTAMHSHATAWKEKDWQLEVL